MPDWSKSFHWLDSSDSTNLIGQSSMYAKTAPLQLYYSFSLSPTRLHFGSRAASLNINRLRILRIFSSFHVQLTSALNILFESQDVRTS